MAHEVVVNFGYGGFGLSELALAMLAKFKVIPDLPYYEMRYDSSGRSGVLFPTNDYYDVIHALPRHHPILVDIVRELGEEAEGLSSSLAIVELHGNKYHIEEHEGAESVIEPKDIDWITIK